ncbi:MAG: tetratricopeptide repeat protein [Magnetococcales bacterium]|nr:tetratricopeptide repeat protein [Magnetococcales bacterium]
MSDQNTLTLPEAINLALGHQKSGRLQQAETIYRQILQASPNHPDANHLLGILSQQTGHHEMAVSLISKAIQVRPNVPNLHLNLGNALVSTGKLEQAVNSFEQAIFLKPDYLEAHVNLGSTWQQLNKHPQAIESLQNALHLHPDLPELHLALGRSLQETGQLEEATACFNRSLALNPKDIKALLHLGMVLAKNAKNQEAKTCFQQILTLEPNIPQAHFNLGNIFQKEGDHTQAADCFQSALALRPNHAETHYNLGKLFLLQNNYKKAIPCFRKALTLKPGIPDILNNLGIALWETGMLSDSVTHFKHALSLDPDHTQALHNLGRALASCGQPEQAIICYQKGHERQPNSAKHHNYYLFMLNYLHIDNPTKIIDSHTKWDRIHGKVGREKIFSHDLAGRETKNRLRIGYVSPDFRTHAVSYFIEPILQNHDRNRFEIFAYAEVPKPDATTYKLQSRVDTWRSTVGLSNEQLARTIYEDQIDILVDLAGHSADNRLVAFTYKPAPIQATYLGYFATTGLKNMDYWITDTAIHPHDDMQWASETLHRLPRCYMCYQPRAGLPKPVQSPRKDGNVVFGSFNNMSKITPKILDAWSQILLRVNGSRLLMKSNDFSDPHLTKKMLENFTRHGVKPERIRIVAKVPTYNDHMGMYSEIDIALDTFPYTGATTTADTLWMGVPVVTLAGNHFVERMSLSLLSAVGHPEWCAENLEAYMALAVEMAAQGPRSSEERQTLRQQMAASPLCDPQDMTRSLEEAYEEMWRIKTAKQGK